MVDVTARKDSLAYSFQEALTAIVRVGSQQQVVGNSEAFRAQLRAALRSAMEHARTLGYPSDLIQMALFATVAFLDESVLNLQSPAFADWSRRPLQEELFGGHTAGEVFFRNLQELLGRQDSRELADTLEIYCLCILLGFKGRYAMHGGGELQGYVRQIRDKINRIRGNATFLEGGGAAPEIRRTATVDRWSRRLAIACACLLVLVLLLFGGFLYSLSTQSSEIQHSSLNMPQERP